MTYPDSLLTQANWILNNKSKYHIQAVLHLGDVVFNDTDAEWNAIDAMYDLFDAADLPYLVSRGNHDSFDAVNRGEAVKFNATFPTARYTSKSWWSGGFYEIGKSQNAYLIMGDYLFLTLEFGPRQVIIDWAKTIAAANPTKKIVFVTHCLEYEEGPRFTTTGDDFNPHLYFSDDTHDGQEIWDEFGKLYSNLVLCFSGHHLGNPYGTPSRHTATGDAANPVESMFCNWQTSANNGSLRLVLFFGNNILVRTYDPVSDTWISDANNYFWLVMP